MHRKTYSMNYDYNEVNSSKNKNYDWARLSSSINPLFENSVQLSCRTRNQQIKPSLSIPSAKSHTRNYSDFMLPPTKRCDTQIYEPVLNTENRKVKFLQQKLHLIEGRLDKAEKMISSIGFEEDKYRKQVFVKKNPFQRDISLVSQNKLYQSEIRNRINSLHMKSSSCLNAPINIKENQQTLLQINKKIQQKIEAACQLILTQIKLQVRENIRELNEKIYKLSIAKDISQDWSIEANILKSNRKYYGNPISFVYEQYIKRNDGQSQRYNSIQKQNRLVWQDGSCINKILYYIDPEGYLLDENSNYLVNSQLKQIKLTDKQIRMLAKHNILRH